MHTKVSGWLDQMREKELLKLMYVNHLSVCYSCADSTARAALAASSDEVKFELSCSAAEQPRHP